MFSKETKKHVLSEIEVFLEETHLKFFPSCPKLFSKDATSSLKKGSLWRNFPQDTVRQALNRMVQVKLTVLSEVEGHNPCKLHIFSGDANYCTLR